jgi:LacI family transcriptional regulator
MKDVALEAGVSIATVSRTLGGGDRSISLPLRTAVLEAAEKLQYRPSAAARRLRTKSSSLIGVVVQSVGDGYIGEVVLGIQSRARELGFQLLFFASEGREDLESEALEVFLSEQVTELISVSPTGSPRVLKKAVEEGLKVAVINWDVEVPERYFEALEQGPMARQAANLASRVVDKSICHVTFDDVGAAAAATSHLLDLGHLRIAHLRGPNVRSSLLRLIGFRRTLEEAELWPQPIIRPESPVMDSREKAVSDFLKGEKPPLAMVVYDDLSAVATLRAAHQSGWRIPEDLSIVGIDDIQFAAYTNPALTTVAQPKQQLGALAVDALLGDMESGTNPPVLHGSLVIRESTASPYQKTRSVKRSPGPVKAPLPEDLA